MVSSCNCEKKTKPRKKKRTTVPKPKVVKPTVSKTKTNTGNVVKNIVIVNGCCCDKGSTRTRTQSRPAPKKTVPKPKPKVEPIKEIVVIEPVKKKTKKKRNYSPSPLVEYDRSDRPRKKSTKKKTPTKVDKPKVPKTNTKKVSKPTPVKKPKKTPKTVSVTPFIEVVDYDDGYKGEPIQRREKTPKKVEAPRTSKQVVEVIQVEEKPRKSFRESYQEFKENRLARRTEKVGRREETNVVESVPTYYVEESPKSLPAPSKSAQETVYALPSGEHDDLIDVSDCKNLSGKNKEECKKRQKIQKKMRSR